MGLVDTVRAYLADKLDIRFTSHNRSRKQLIKNRVSADNGGTVNQNLLVVNLAQSSSREQAAALKLLAEHFKRGNVLFVDDESKKLADNVQAAENRPVEGGIVKFFEPVLRPKDWQVLRTGLYISYLVGQGLPTKEIRESVIANHGTRGKNLLNLASSGHFESHIKPLYQEMAKAPDFTQDKFYEEFETILREMPFAFFVHSAVSAAELTDIINKKIALAQAYSVHERKIYIHAWGPNVKTVDTCLEALGSAYKVVVNKRIEVVEIVDATIEF